MSMNENFIKLADEAGFCFWRDEPWNPGDIIDWASRYDDEFNRYSIALVLECCKVLETWKGQPFPFDEDLAVRMLKEHFGVK